MDEVYERAGVITELFTWIGLVLGVLLLLAALVVRLLEGEWRAAEASSEVIDGDLQLTWSDEEGTVHRRFLHPEERESLADPWNVVVHYRRSSPDRGHLERKTHASRVLLLLGAIMTAVGVVAVLLSLLVLIGAG